MPRKLWFASSYYMSKPALSLDTILSITNVKLYLVPDAGM